MATLIQTAGQPSLFAHSEFVKEATCARCGAPKQLPSKTAYLYCDHCGALVDYDYRLANLGTDAGITNTVFHQLVVPVQAQLDAASHQRIPNPPGPWLFTDLIWQDAALFKELTGRTYAKAEAAGC